MHSGTKVKCQLRTLLLMFLGLTCSLPSFTQQKGQYVPGQYGLNAGLALQPDPGFTFVNLDLNYSADTLKDSNGVAVPVTGNYSFWMVENMFMYSPAHKLLGGQFTTLAIVNLANASVTADIPGTQLGVTGAGGQGISDTWVQPVNLGWHLSRADTWVGYAFVAPTGEFFPLSSSNNGSGYWGNNFCTGTTFYVTKNKGTQLNLATNWEFHGTKKGTNIIPGQAFTMEWGLGQMLPVRKNLVQLGVIGYDQWQVTANQGPTASFPFYSMHAIGLQTNFISPGKGYAVFFKYLPEYLVKASTQGRTIAFGFQWTLRDPRLKVPTH